MKETKIRNIADDDYKTLKVMATEKDLSLNSLFLEFIKNSVDTYKKSERKRINKRLNELDQQKLELKK